MKSLSRNLLSNIKKISSVSSSRSLIPSSNSFLLTSSSLTQQRFVIVEKTSNKKKIEDSFSSSGSNLSSTEYTIDNIGECTDSLEAEKILFETRRSMMGHFRTGNFSSALDISIKLKDGIKIKYGEINTVYASALNNVALMYKNLGDIPNSLTYYKQALEIYQQVAGEKYSGTLMTMGNLGKLYKDSAMIIFQEEKKKKNKKEQEEYNLKKQNKILLDNKNYYQVVEEAYDILTKVYKLQVETSGLTSKATLDILITLSSVYAMQGDITKGIETLKNVWKTTKEVHTENDPLIGFCLNNLGFLYRIDDKLAEAGESYIEAYKLQEKLYGLDSPEVKVTYNNLEALEEAFKQKDLEKKQNNDSSASDDITSTETETETSSFKNPLDLIKNLNTQTDAQEKETARQMREILNNVKPESERIPKSKFSSFTRSTSSSTSSTTTTTSNVTTTSSIPQEPPKTYSAPPKTFSTPPKNTTTSSKNKKFSRYERK